MSIVGELNFAPVGSFPQIARIQFSQLFGRNTVFCVGLPFHTKWEAQSDTELRTKALPSLGCDPELLDVYVRG